MNKNRLEAFSDGVIAIIITIMVLELKVPHGHEWRLLVPLLPVLGSYILSFVFIGIYWGNHHHLLHTVKVVSPPIIWANLHLLFWLSMVPFVTAWMGENHIERNTIVAYSVVLLCNGIAFTVLQLAIQKTNPFDDDMNLAYSKVKKKGIFSILAYSGSIAFAYVHTYISYILLITVAVSWIIPDRNIEKAVKKQEE